MKTRVLYIFLSMNTLLLVLADAGKFKSIPYEPVINHDLIYGNASTMLTNLGSVDGKSYFSDSNLRTWMQSLRYCADMGFTLATITSTEQLNLLKAAKDEQVFSGWFWTAGRDQHGVGEFLWHYYDTELLPLTSVTNGMGNRTYLTCLCYSANDGYYYIRECDHSHYTLCETPSGTPITGLPTRPTPPPITWNPPPITWNPPTSGEEVEENNNWPAWKIVVVVIGVIIGIIVIGCLAATGMLKPVVKIVELVFENLDSEA